MKSRMSRTFPLLGALLLAGAGAFASGEADAGGEAAAGPAPLILSAWGGQEVADFYAANAAEFSRRSQGRVDASFRHITADYGQKVQAMIAAGDAPDVFLLGSTDAPLWWRKGLLLELTDTVHTHGLLDDSKWYSSLFSSSRDGDTFFGLPDAMNVFLLIYNKSEFDKHGVAHPTADWTWDDLKEAAIKLTIDENGDGVNELWGFNVWHAWSMWYQVFLWSWGAEWAIDEHEANTLPWLEGKDWREGQMVDSGAAAALRWLQNGIYKDEFIRPRVGATVGGEAFQQGLTAMDIIGTWYLETTILVEDFDWDIAPIPRVGKGDAHVTHMTVSPWVVNARTEYPEEASEFAAFMCCDNFVMETMRRDTPLSKPVAFSDAYLKIPGAPDNYRLRVDIVDMIDHPRYWNRQIPNVGEVTQAFQTEMEKLLINTQTPEETAANVDREVTRLIAKGWE